MHQVVLVVVHGLAGYAKYSGNLLDGVSLHKELQYFPLPLRQLIRRRLADVFAKAREQVGRY